MIYFIIIDQRDCHCLIATDTMCVGVSSIQLKSSQLALLTRRRSCQEVTHLINTILPFRSSFVAHLKITNTTAPLPCSQPLFHSIPDQAITFKKRPLVASLFSKLVHKSSCRPIFIMSNQKLFRNRIVHLVSPKASRFGLWEHLWERS